MAGNDTTRTHPDVKTELLNDFKTAIAAFNEGKVKGRLSPAFEEAMELYIATMFLRSPVHLEQLEQYVDEDDVDDPDAYRDRVMNEYVEDVRGSLSDAAQRLPGNVQSGPTDQPLDQGPAGKSGIAAVGEGASGAQAGMSEEETRELVREELEHFFEQSLTGNRETQPSNGSS